jgi:hypothetical protein
MWHSIKQIIEKIKHFYTTVPLVALFGVIIILLGFVGFGLAQLASRHASQQGITMSAAASPESTISAGATASKVQGVSKGMVVASKRGKKYHYPWCSGAKRMSPKNKRWFNSVKEARSAGYLPAKNCKGLE